MNENVEKAAAIIKDECRASAMWQQAAEALESAGLLLTPLHERALAACEAFAVKYLPMSDRTLVLDKDVWMRVHDVGRESLAAKEKAKGPRWVVRRLTVAGSVPERWSVWDDATNHPGSFASFVGTEDECNRVAAALNGVTE